VLTDLTGPVGAGDRVVVNTTAVELGLGTGGWHVVHWNLARDAYRGGDPGHTMKLRYTSLQHDGNAPGSDRTDLGGRPVVAASLHSQLAGIAVAFKAARPDARLVYVMTDGGALPIVLSDLVHELRTRQLLDGTVTCGHAFGGDTEAVSIYDALAGADADAIVVAMGPGGVGTGTELGFSGIELGAILDAAANLGGTPIATLRASEADPRPRHRGISHHSRTVLTLGTRTRAIVAVPESLSVDADISARHEVTRVPDAGIVKQFAALGLDVASMGRSAADDPLLFECAAAAGTVASRAVQ
jgi:hypothetical protein